MILGRDAVITRQAVEISRAGDTTSISDRVCSIAEEGDEEGRHDGEADRREKAPGPRPHAVQEEREPEMLVAVDREHRPEHDDPEEEKGGDLVGRGDRGAEGVAPEDAHDA